MKKYIVNGKPVKAKSILDAVKKVKDKIINAEARNPEDLKKIIQSWSDRDDGIKVRVWLSKNTSSDIYYYHDVNGYYVIPTGVASTTTEYTHDRAKETALKYANKIFDSKSVKDTDSLVQEAANTIKGINEIFSYKMQKALENKGFDVSYDESSNLGYILYAKKNGKKIAIISKNKADPDANDIVQGNFVIGLIDSKTCKDESTKEKLIKLWAYIYGQSKVEAKKHIDTLSNKEIEEKYKLLNQGFNENARRSFYEDSAIKDEQIIKVTLDGETYSAIYRGRSMRYPNMADVYIDDLLNYYDARKNPKDDLGRTPNDGKYYISIARIKKENPNVILDSKCKDTTISYKGYDIEYNFYGQNEYTVQYQGDDVWFKSIDEAKKFIDEITLKKDSINEGEFTIEINGEIYEDQFGNPYHFNSYEKAMEFIKEHELKGAKVTRQYGKVDSKSCKDMPYNGTSQVKEINKGYAIVLRSRWEKYGVNSGIETWEPSLDGAKAHKDSLTRADGLAFVIIDCNTKQVIDSNCKDKSFIDGYESFIRKWVADYKFGNSLVHLFKFIRKNDPSYVIYTTDPNGNQSMGSSEEEAIRLKEKWTGEKAVLVERNVKDSLGDESPEELIKRYQKKVDTAIESFGRIGGGLYDELDDNGLYVKEENGKYIVKKKIQDSNCKDDNILGRKVIIRPRDVRMDKYVDEKGVIYSYEGTNYDDIVEVKLDNGEYVEVKFDEIKFLDSITKDGSCKDESMFMILNKDEGCYLYNVDISAATYSLTNNANKADKFTLSEANRIINILKKYNFDNLTTSEFLDSKCKDGWIGQIVETNFGSGKIVDVFEKNGKRIFKVQLSPERFVETDKIKFNGFIYDGVKDVNPNEGESKEDFIARFMSETKEEYPDEKQRYAVANSYWERRNK